MNSPEILPSLINLAVALLIAALVFNYYKNRVTSPSERYSTFGPRFWSPSIDTVVLWPFTTLIPLLVVYAAPSASVAVSMIATIGYYAYSIYFHGKHGGTIGKLKCKIRVLDAKSEAPIGYKQAFLRDCVPLVLSMAFYANALTQDADSIENAASFTYAPMMMGAWFIAEILTMLTNKKRRALHDLIAGTVVIRIATVEDPRITVDTSPVYAAS